MGTDDVLRRELPDRRYVFGAGFGSAPESDERRSGDVSGPVAFTPFQATSDKKDGAGEDFLLDSGRPYMCSAVLSYARIDILTFVADLF